MLISQRIAKDINFLKNAVDYKGGKDHLNKMRLDIIHSVKFIVGRELLDFGTNSKKFLENLLEDRKSEEQIQTRFGLYNKYCRLPFPSIVIENDTVLLLLITTKPFCWNVYAVDPSGRISPAYLVIELTNGDDDVAVFVKYLVPQETIVKLYGYDEAIKKNKKLADNLSILFIAVMEVLLFMNAQNIKHVKYVPTKKENVSVPRVLQPKYTYHILDLFKQKNTYTSLEEIENNLCKPRAATTLRRAVLVRGHFKQRRTGLFFWDFHTRNKHNVETHGIVDKDYRVHSSSKQSLVSYEV